MDGSEVDLWLIAQSWREPLKLAELRSEVTGAALILHSVDGCQHTIDTAATKLRQYPIIGAKASFPQIVTENQLTVQISALG